MATLNAVLRNDRGKGAARKLRATGRVPAVSYGQGKAGRSLSLNAHELELLLATINPDNTIIELRVDGAKPAQALIREIQRHPSRRQILHVDFFQVDAGEKLHVEVPIRFLGTPKGVVEGDGVLQEILRELSVECLPADIPAMIDINIEHLGLGEAIHVSDVKVDRATILNDGELMICSVTTPTVAVLPETSPEAGEGGAAGPEVIGAGKESAEAE